MLQVFKVGDEIEGYCSGQFGRDDYARKVCVMVTTDYAVFERVDEDGKREGATVLNYFTALLDMVDKWRVK